MTLQKPPLRVAHFQRLAGPGNFSVERLFEDARAAMPEDISVTVHLNKYMSRGVLGRLYDAFAARKKSQSVNHVLGDVHYLTWFLPRKRTILTVLDCVSLERLTGARRFILWLLWYWFPLRKVTAVTVISTFTKDSLLKWAKYPSERVHIIAPSLCPLFVFSPKIQNAAKKQRVLQIGTKKNKNVHRLLEALSGLDITLVLVGVMDDKLIEHARAHSIEVENHVGLTLEQLIDQYRLADVLSFVSTYEGFGMPIVEAQAIGRPVVTSNVCSMPETAGDAAILVDPFDVDAIRSGLRRVLEDQDLVADLVEKGRRNAQRFSAKEIAKAYATLYRHVDSEANS